MDGVGAGAGGLTVAYGYRGSVNTRTARDGVGVRQHGNVVTWLLPNWAGWLAGGVGIKNGLG